MPLQTAGGGKVFSTSLVGTLEQWLVGVLALVGFQLLMFLKGLLTTFKTALFSRGLLVVYCLCWFSCLRSKCFFKFDFVLNFCSQPLAVQTKGFSPV